MTILTETQLEDLLKIEETARTVETYKNNWEEGFIKYVMLYFSQIDRFNTQHGFDLTPIHISVESKKLADKLIKELLHDKISFYGPTY